MYIRKVILLKVTLFHVLVAITGLQNKLINLSEKSPKSSKIQNKLIDA